jgi:hypothetical protein
MNNPTLTLDVLLDALLWCSAVDHRAYLHRETGKMYLLAPDFESDEGIADEMASSDNYVALPNQDELELGRELIFRFVRQVLPDQINAVTDIFRRKGAYRHIKNYLDNQGQLDQWYAFKQHATEQALRAWCEAENIQLVL